MHYALYTTLAFQSRENCYFELDPRTFLNHKHCVNVDPFKNVLFFTQWIIDDKFSYVIIWFKEFVHRRRRILHVHGRYWPCM